MIKNMAIGFFSFLLFTNIAWAQSEISDVSLIQLIVNPEKYEGKYVRVHGFLRLEHEGNGFYLHREDYERSLYKNGVWVYVAETEANQQFNMKYVLIEGTFDSKDRGHMGLWSGAIKDIKRVVLWNPRQEDKTKNVDAPQKYIVNLIWISGTQPAEYIFVINSKMGFRTVDSFKKFIAHLPEGSILEWNPGCRRTSGEPLLSSEEEMNNFKRFCEEHKIIFNLIPTG